jgi:hypothetical protein
MRIFSLPSSAFHHPSCSSFFKIITSSGLSSIGCGAAEKEQEERGQNSVCACVCVSERRDLNQTSVDNISIDSNNTKRFPISTVIKKDKNFSFWLE